MKRLLAYILPLIIIITIINIVYYNRLNNKYIDYIDSTINLQVQTTGISIDNTNNAFTSDLNKICFIEDLSQFFSNPKHQQSAKQHIKIFYSRYQDFISAIKISDNKKNEFTLKKDDITEEWLEQQYILHNQGEMIEREKVVFDGKKYNYFLPIIKKGSVVGDIIVTINYQKYFEKLFAPYYFKNLQWQWVIDEKGDILYTNVDKQIQYNKINKINEALQDGSSMGNLTHTALYGNDKVHLLSSYFSTELLQKNFTIVFSIIYDSYLKYIIKHSSLNFVISFLLIGLILIITYRHIIKIERQNVILSDFKKSIVSIMKNIPIGIVLHDSRKKIIKANTCAASTLGYDSVKDMEGRLFPEIATKEISEYHTLFSGISRHISRLAIINIQGKKHLILQSSLPIALPEIKGIMQILFDITDFFKANRKAIESNNAKDLLISRIIFELRTPLNSIIELSDLFQQYDFKDDIKNRVTLLHLAAEQMLSVVNYLVDFTKMENNAICMEERPVNIHELIRSSITTANRIIDNNVKIEYDTDKNIPEEIISDPFRIGQILNTIVGNFVKNTVEGKIVLTCRLKSKHDDKIVLLFDISNTAYHFNEEDIQRTLDTYNNLNSFTSRSSEISVLGNMLAHHFIKTLDGDLHVESLSELNGSRGLKITFSIAAYFNDRKSKNIDITHIDSFNKIKALIITDIQNRDESLLTKLHKSGIDLSVTSFQDTTISQIKTNSLPAAGRYNLIIIDDYGTNGFKTAEALRESGITDNFIILFIGPGHFRGYYRKSVTLGMDDYITTPVDEFVISQTLKRLFPNLTKQGDAALTDTKDDVKILVVDDSPMTRKVFETVLKSLGYQCKTASNGYMGYDMALKEDFNLILIDLVMPGIDGYKTAKKILSKKKSSIIIGLTADSTSVSKEKAGLTGIKEILYKPVHVSVIKSVIDHYLA